MEVNVNELSGAALDWAVAKAVGAYATANGSSEIWGCKIWSVPGFYDMRWDDWTPSTDWAQGGPLRDAHGVALWDVTGGNVAATIRGESADFWIDETELDADAVGPTALIALCRAIVSVNLGTVVNVPDELL